MRRPNKVNAIVRAPERMIMDSIGLDPCTLVWKRAASCVKQRLYQMKSDLVAEIIRTEDGNYSRNSMASRFRRSQDGPGRHDDEGIQTGTVWMYFDSLCGWRRD